MTALRLAAVAGLFYPDDPHQLHAMLHDLLRAAPSVGGVPKAIIAPHAGYVYSGPVAASAYAPLAPAKERIRRVVLLGPSHRVGFRGIALASADAYATPLGIVPIDRAALAEIQDLPFVGLLDQAHAQEHSLEVQLPFLQEVLGEFQLVPLVVGEATPEQVAEVLDRLWGGPETLIVVSSDLSHYHDYASARRLDRATSEAIVNLRPEAIGYDSACGRVPVNGLLHSARRRGLTARTVDLRNSGDTAGDKSRVVGYGAYLFEEPAAHALAPEQRRLLLDIAKASIQYGLTHPAPPGMDLAAFPPAFAATRASFVTLNLDGRLRGCIGSLEAHRPLALDVAHNAYAAAFQDPRFSRVTDEEFPRLDLHISLLTPAEPLAFASEADLLRQLVPFADGLILQEGGRRGTFLPSVWASLPEPAQFLAQLKQKAGLPADYWSESVRAWRYRTEVIE